MLSLRKAFFNTHTFRLLIKEKFNTTYKIEFNYYFFKFFNLCHSQMTTNF